jgi:hypothetical protein
MRSAPAGGSQQDRAHGGVRLDRARRRGQRRDQVSVERIEPIGPVQRDIGHAVATFE